MGSAFRHGSHRCGQQTRTRGPRGPEVGDLDAVHWIWPMASLVFFVVSWSFPGICLVSFLYVFGVLDFFLYLTGLCIFRKYFGKVTFWYTLCFLYFSGVFTNYGALVFSSIWTVCFSYFSGSVFCIFLACFWYFF